MNKRNAKVEFGGGGSPSCFVHISWQISHPSSDGINVLKIQTHSRSIHYLSVIGGGSHSSSSSSTSNFTIRIHSKLGSSLGLVENEVVTVSEVSTPIREIQSANVVCASSDDWEILESNTDAVINGLLNQLRVIYPGLKFPFWVTKSLQINLKIESVSPTDVEFGVLSANSEIMVPSVTSVSSKPFSFSKKHFRLRVHPLSIPDSVLCTFPTSSLLLKNTRNAFIFRESLKMLSTCEDENADPFFYVEILFSNTQAPVKVFFLELCEISSELLTYFWVTNPPCIYLHPEFINEFNIELKSFIWMKQIEPQLEQNVKNVGKISLLGVSDAMYKNKERKIFGSILDECKSFIQASLALGRFPQNFQGPNNGCLLIEGNTGMGKTTLCNRLTASLEGPPYYVHCETFSCAKWRGKKPETIEKELRAILDRAQSMQPSLMVLDDLDVLTHVGMAPQENVQEEFLQFKICETIRESLMAYWDEQIAVVATAKSKEVLHAYWKSRQGFNFFHKTVFLPPLTPTERLWVFENFLNRYNLKERAKCIPNIANLLKNIHDQYASPRLISNIAKKWAAQLLSNSNCNEDNLEKCIKQEIHYFEMEASSGSKKSVATNIKWENIGGLYQIKEDLVKILKWPIKYKKLFKNSPIKLPSGILFYGYPGTGKTLLGLSIPSLVNTKFIHIKGPELLSKYIGASEQAVQDVFKRRGHDSTGVSDRVVNQFLAEMDGIEGGLGQGVYLVGATSRPDLIDPAVLRPGRLDKHLFFDLPTKEERKEILVKLGSQVNLQIETVENSPDLESLVDSMKGLSGADIHSLVCSAQLAAVQRYLGKLAVGVGDDNNEPFSSNLAGNLQLKNEELTPSDIPVKISDLAEAFKTFRPSLHGQELARFTKIYTGFSSQGEEGGARTTQQMQELAGKRATLA